MADYHIKEEHLVDFVLGNLDDLQTKRVSNHIAICRSCRVEWESWQEILTNEVDFEPSEQLSDRLIDDLNRLEDREQKMRKGWRAKRWGVGLICAAVIFFSFILSGTFKTQDPSYQVLQNDEIVSQDIQQKQATNQLEITPVNNIDHVNGEVWINPYTQEMLVEVNGLVPLSSRDYQMWIIDGNDVWIGELLQLDNGNVRIFYRGQDVSEFKWMQISVEPKGGSHVPTGPEALYVDLKAE